MYLISALLEMEPATRAVNAVLKEALPVGPVLQGKLTT